MERCFSGLPALGGSPFSVRTVLRLTNLRVGRGYRVRRLALKRGGLLLLVGLITSASGRCVFRDLFRSVRRGRIRDTMELVMRVSACVGMVLLDSSSRKCRVYSEIVR